MGKMLEIVCESQMIYSHGECMCTTACMTLLIALLSRKIDMRVIDDLYMRRWLKTIMKGANDIHATMETTLDSRPKTISVSDYINIIGIEQTIPDARVVEYIINNELGNDVCYHFVSTTFFVCIGMCYRYCWY